MPGEYQSRCDFLALGLNYRVSDLSSASVSPRDRQLSTHTYRALTSHSRKSRECPETFMLLLYFQKRTLPQRMNCAANHSTFEKDAVPDLLSPLCSLMKSKSDRISKSKDKYTYKCKRWSTTGLLQSFLHSWQYWHCCNAFSKSIQPEKLDHWDNILLVWVGYYSNSMPIQCFL